MLSSDYHRPQAGCEAFPWHETSQKTRPAQDMLSKTCRAARPPCKAEGGPKAMGVSWPRSPMADRHREVEKREAIGQVKSLCTEILIAEGCFTLDLTSRLGFLANQLLTPP